MYFYPVLSKNYYDTLIGVLFLHLQCSKQTHFHHRALCKLQKLWNSIHCTTRNTK